jgi:hypothetical protein
MAMALTRARASFGAQRQADLAHDVGGQRARTMPRMS